MRTKIILAACAIVMVLCLVGCTAKTQLQGTAWKSDKVTFVEKQLPIVVGSGYTATLLFEKDGLLALEIALPMGGVTNYFDSTGTWSANSNQLTYDISADWGTAVGSYNFQGTFPVKIDKTTMQWLNDDSSVNTEWTKLTN